MPGVWLHYGKCEREAREVAIGWMQKNATIDRIANSILPEGECVK